MASSANLKETRKRKVEEEMRKFNEKWTSEYFFIENADSRPLYLICNQTVNVNKEYNIKRHYDSKHADGVYGKLKGRDKELKVKQLKEQLKSQRFMFQKMHTDCRKLPTHVFYFISLEFLIIICASTRCQRLFCFTLYF